MAGNLAKFGRHAELRAFLAGTGRRVLVEASPVDGSGVSERNRAFPDRRPNAASARPPL
ncbi:hypothetical protein [Micromonospora inaquosa]|uniref:hypothetical protein n=1 Tax=Micromonospora inaquosa TaxID=2203716 RepID=UPI003CC5CDF4